MRCGSCGAQYDPARFLDEMDEEFDQAFAGMPLDRL
ncbi:MAG: dual CXXC motif small (seleno)protein [Thermodesulfobacteriota bacterium]